MLDKLKDMYALRKQAQELQAKLGQQQVTGSSRNANITITLNGNQEITHVKVAEHVQLVASSVEKDIKEAFADAHNKLKSILMSSMKDLL